MTDASAEAALDAYIADPENMAYLASAEFERRGVELFDRFEAGETMPAAQAAEILRLPFEVFRYVYGTYLAFKHAEAMLGAEAARATKH